MFCSFRHTEFSSYVSLAMSVRQSNNWTVSFSSPLQNSNKTLQRASYVSCSVWCLFSTGDCASIVVFDVTFTFTSTFTYSVYSVLFVQFAIDRTCCSVCQCFNVYHTELPSYVSFSFLTAQNRTELGFNFKHTKCQLSQLA